MKSAAIMCVAAAVLVVGLSITCAMRAVPKKPGKVYGPSKMPQKPEPQYEYDRLLAKYQANIDDLARQYQELMRRSWNERVQSRFQKSRAREMSLDLDNESKLLEQLRAASLRRPQKKLGFDGEVEENFAFIPTSDVSARVFRALYDEKLCDPGEIVSHLSYMPMYASKEWKSLLQDIADHSQPDTSVWRSSRRLLYTMGISRKQYRPILEELALQPLSAGYLRTLLFETDKETGEAQPVKSSQNSALLDKILSNKDASPESLEVCAEYLAETGDKAQAERICLDLLSQQYTLRDSDKEHDPKHRDYQLGRARSSAMYLMFYKIRTSVCFKAVYDISRTSKLDAHNLMDKDAAESLIYQVSHSQ